MDKKQKLNSNRNRNGTLSPLLGMLIKDFSLNDLLSKQEQSLRPYNPRSDSSQAMNYISQFLPVRMLRIVLHGILIKTGIWKRLIYSNLKLDWFYEFKEYWEKELGGRPLAPNDFWFLYGVTRLAQAEARYLEEKDEQDPNQFLGSWRQTAISLRLIFHNTLKLALHPLVAYRFVKYIPKGARVCEYGCGIAPITNSLIKYYPHLKLKFTCADIPHLLFHYMRWRFRSYDFVECLPINDPLDENPLGDRKYDVIFVMAVFEHLPKPLAIAKHLHNALVEGGILIFDYIKSEAKGLDSYAGLKERLEVLKFIQKHFEILEGEIYLDGRNVGVVICRKTR